MTFGLRAILRAGAAAHATILAACVAFAPEARAQLILETLPEIQDVGIVEHRGDQVPTDLVFTDSLGRSVRTGEFFDGSRPVILVMAYYDCPLLCTLVLNRVQRVLNELKWTAGEDFRVVTVSFDHLNTTAMAREKQQTYLLGLNKPVPESAWPFLTGDVANIRALTTAVGYHYKFLPEKNEFSHPAALIFLTPTGAVHNYLEKLDFSAGEVQIALAEAADGRIGTIFDRVKHFCFRYDPKTGRYSADAFAIMRIGASACAVALGGFVFFVARQRGRRIRGVHASELQENHDQEARV
ncbi:MAG: SCO family protein [Phycisphaerae bacterium]|nr:SCO family protein [Phycisphaerae bacterium]